MREQHGFTKEQRGPMHDGQGVLHFGNYDLVRRIDMGGMGEVYLAHQRTAFGREVAVKIIRSDLVHDITARKRFLREAEVSAYLKHDHILPLFEFGEEQGRLFLVTPYIKGGTLAKRLQTGAIALSEVYQLFTALVQAVSYLHKRGVIHRDLKPSNILLDREDDSGRVYVRLIDFGIASLQGTSASAPLTTAGHEMGTVAYMAPERLDGVAAASNDIYSLGVILYQMLTGQLPDAKYSVSLPQPLEYVVRHCTEQDPGNRFASADALLQTFEQAYKSLTSPRLSSVAVPQPPPVVPIAPARSIPTPPPTAAEVDHAPITPSSRPATSAPRPAANTGAQKSIARSDSGTMHTYSPSAQLQRAELRLTAQAAQNTTFNNEDYNAPTSYVDPTRAKAKHAADGTALLQPPTQARKKSQRSLVMLISALIVVVISAIGGLGYLVFQSAISADVTISPRAQMVSSVFTITAQPNASGNTGSTSIAAYVYTSTQNSTKQGPTTGLAHCVLGILNCQQAVSLFDVDTQAEQARESTKTLIQQALQKKVAADGATTVGNIVFQDVSVSADPQVGTVSKTVSVTLTEQGSVEGIKTTDVQNRAKTLLQSKLPANYTLIDQTTRVGQPVVQGIDAASGQVTIAVAAGGMGHYQISDADMTTIRNHIKGMSQTDAKKFIEQQANIDPNAISIHLSYGDTIPNNAQQIKIVTADPVNMPQVQLTPVPAK